MDNQLYNKKKSGVDTLDQLIESFYVRFAHKTFILFNQPDDDGIEQTASTKKQNEFILHYFHHRLFVRTAKCRNNCFGQRDIKRAVY